MGWASAVKNPTRRTKAPARTFAPPTQEIALAKVDWDRLVTLDFETFYDDAYTLSKLSTSEYIRDPRFKAQMVGVKIGNKPTKTYHTAASITLALRSINWDTHALLVHNCQFDGFILSHQYGIVPHRYYDTLSMARGLHSNEIGAGLHEVSIFYGGEGKIEGGLEPTKGMVNWPAQLIKATSKYCANDVEECYRIFREMAKIYPADEMELIHMTMRMFCAPVLRVDIPRVQAEHAREIAHRQKTLVESIPNIEQYDTWDRSGPKPKYLGVLDKKSGRDDLTGDERIAAVAKKVMGSNERFVNVLVEAGVPKDKIPMKLSDAWMKLRGEEREKQIDKKWTYAFAKTDLNFIDLPDAVWEMHPDWDSENPRDVMRASLLEDRLTRLVAGRLATKSTTNITRAARFIEAGRDGMKLPVGYGYARAHCLTGDAQVLTRGGWVALEDWRGGEIAQWSPDGSIRFAPATPNSFRVRENLVRAKSRYHSSTYTKGHTLPAFASTGKFRTRRAGEALEARFDIPISGVLDGSANITPLEAQIAVMVQADGNVRSGVGRGLCVRFGFKKTRKIERCKALLTEAGIGFTEAREGDVVRIRVGAKHCVQMIRWVGAEKMFSAELFDAPAETKKAFVSELAFWDGSVEPQPKGFSYSTTNAYNAQFVATMAHLAGRSAFTTSRPREKGWSPAFVVYIRSDKKTRSAPQHYEEIPHDGLVYCPTTETGYFMVRQRGNIVVTGNTGRWGGNNKMNMQNLVRGGELRLSILADEGHVLVVCDSGQIEARVNGWLWDQDDLLDAFRASDAYNLRVEGMEKKDRPLPEEHEKDAYCRYASDVYGRPVNVNDKDERQLGKICIAEGELVLTSRGPVPIERVALTDLLWDGVEWVSHCGVVDQGIREVITYDGLTATPDHEVFTEDGRILQIGRAASEMARLQATGIEGRGLRFCDRAVVADTPRKRLSVRQGEMRPDWYYEADVPGQLAAREDDLVSEEWAASDAACASLGAQVRRDYEPLPEFCGHGLGELRGAPQELALHRRQARVYDIANAGPRRRFTVSGKLVLNCVLGLGFKMGAQKLQMTLARGAMGAPRMNFPLADVQKMVGIYRSRNHRIVAGWAICKNIISDMAMGVEGTHKCITWGGDGEGDGWIRLPNGLHLKYPDLKQGVNEEHGFPEWTYQASEIRKKLYDGLLCLAGDTEVLTDSGWKRIDHVTPIDRVWDGDQWVTHDGVALQGTKQVIDFGGVWMTPDHRVSVDGGWHEAQHTTHAQAASSFARHHRMPEWFSDGGGASWERRPLHAVAHSLRLRAAQDYVGNGVSQGEDDVMRVSDKAVPPRRQDLPRDVQTPRVRGVAEHARPLSKSAAPSLQKLRRAWDRGLPSMAGLRDVLGGYAQRLSAWVDARARKQRTGLHPEQLCLGDLQEPEQQSPKLGAVRDPVGCADHRRSHGCQWSEPQHTLLSPPTEMATRPDAVPVYDILNAGPNRRFTIRGGDGLPFVVHNCENLVQALARIVVASQMLMVEKKYPIVMTTHDEGVAHVKKRDGAKAFTFMRKCFTTPLWWCPDIPLWAEGGYDDNYSK